MSTSWSPDQTWPPASSGSVSAALIRRVYGMVLEDTSTVAVVAVGSLASAVAFAGVAVPAWLLGGVDVLPTGRLDPVPLCVLALAAWATAFVSVVFNGAVVASGVARLDGHPITARQALAVAWGRKRELAAWAVLTTVVGMLANLLNRFGLAGAVLRLVADLAWAVATMLVLPVIIVEGRMPRDAVSESVRMMKTQLMLTVKAKVRLYLPLMVATFVGMFVMAIGVIAFVRYRTETPEWSLMGLIIAGVGFLVVLMVACIQGAADALLNTVLYRHARGQALPGIDPRDLPRLGPAWIPGPGSPGAA
jgi:hypothetical protein